MKKRRLIAVALGVSAVVAFGGLYASNMGFKLNVLLEEQTPGVSATGQTQLGLPYNPQGSMTSVTDLFHDINATSGNFPCSNSDPYGSLCAVVSISRFLATADAFETYTGASSGGRYPLDGVEGQRIQMRQRVNYIVVGSHDPGRVINLDAPGTNGSASGQTELSFPYHGTATNAVELFDEINAQSASGNAVVSIARYLPEADALDVYTGTGSTGNFTTSCGESYRIQVREDVPYVPSHY